MIDYYLLAIAIYTGYLVLIVLNPLASLVVLDAE